MNQKGIVLSSLVYALLVFFFLLLIALLMMLRYRQMAISNLSDDANGIYDDANILGYSKTFSYTGTYQTFTAQLTGDYKIELWGAQGGNSTTTVGGASVAGGKGAYTKGEVYLTKGTSLYFYVGGSSISTAGGYNGGGSAYDIYNAMGGGGATDVRLTTGAWNDTSSLRSRIMVAAGGGGADGYVFGSVGGYSGGLTGSSGYSYCYNSTCAAYTVSTGGSQTAGGVGGIGFTTGNAGTFGIGGSTTSAIGAGAAGGGGYYGGGSGAYNSSVVGSGAGGSSFISGFTGCNALDLNGNHTGQPNHFSGYVFTGGIMINGATSMPAPDGGMEVGHSGDGYAKITNIP